MILDSRWSGKVESAVGVPQHCSTEGRSFEDTKWLKRHQGKTANYWWHRAREIGFCARDETVAKCFIIWAYLFFRIQPSTMFFTIVLWIIFFYVVYNWLTMRPKNFPPGEPALTRNNYKLIPLTSVMTLSPQNHCSQQPNHYSAIMLAIVHFMAYIQCTGRFCSWLYSSIHVSVYNYTFRRLHAGW
jgi:hypothetical protein